MKRRISSAEPLGRARLLNKCLVCNKESDDGSGKANLVCAGGDTVWGVMYEIDEAELGKLDRCEKGYERKCLDVLTDEDSLVKAYVYVSSELTDDARPYDWYKEFMLKGACEHHLPSFYRTRLEQIESKPDLRCRSKH
jgi:hypothetical protein